MIRTTSLLAAGSLLGLLLPNLTQDPKPATDHKAAPQDKTAAGTQAQGQEAPKKTGVHATFAQLAGEYDVASTFVMGDQKSETKGRAKLTTVLDGRFLLEENEGELMVGQKIKGLRIYGWNAEAKQFEGTWMYTMSNGIMRLTGTTNADRKSINFEGVAQETKDMKQTFEIVAKRGENNTLVFTMKCKGPDGKLMASLEETYTRRK